MNLLVFGASGRTGRHVVEQALSAGHRVRAFVRDLDSLPIAHPHLQFFQGDVRQPKAVTRAVKGQDAVISALGPTGHGPSTVLTEAGNLILSAMAGQGVRRIIWLSSAGIDGELPGLAGRLHLYQFRHSLADHRGAAQLLRHSDLDWLLVRPVRLLDGPAQAVYRVSVEGLPVRARAVSRADVARFALQQLADDTYLRRSPCIAY